MWARSAICSLCVLVVALTSTTITTVTLCATEENKENKIYFLLMLPFAESTPQKTVRSDPDSLSPRLMSQPTAATYDDGHDIAPAAYLAVQQINNRSDLLRGYTLDLVRSDGGCNIIGRTVVSFASDVFHSNLSLLGVIGPSCSDSSTTIAQLTSHKDVSLVSLHYGTVVKLNDREEYPNTFGMLSSTELWVSAYVEVIRHNLWKNIALLVSDTSADLLEWANYFQQAMVPLEASGYILHTFPILDTYFPHREIKDAFTRVIFVLSTPKLSKRLLCIAYHQGLVYPFYQFVFTDRLESEFDETVFNYDDEMYNCTTEQMRTALYGHLNFFLSFNTEPSSLETDTGLCYEEFEHKYNETTLWYRGHFDVHSEVTYWASPAYDAVWALSFALNNSLDELNERNLSLLDSKNGKRHEITNVTQKNMLHVDFQGVSGHIQFNESSGSNRIANRKLNLFRYTHTTAMIVGFYVSEQFTVVSNSENVTEPTFISSSFSNHYKRLSLGVAVPILVLSIAIWIFTLPFHIVNIIYRNHHVIKATSSRLNHLIFVGGYLILLGIVALTLSEMLVLSYNTQFALCNTAPFFLSIGLTLIIGTVCFKTWRLYEIFVKWKSQRPSSILLKDSTLIVFMVLMTLADVLVCVLWTVIDPRRPANTTTIETVENQTLPIAVTNLHCHSNNNAWWISAITVHKCVLLCFSLFFVYSMRNVQNKDFQTQNISMFIYTFTVVFAVGFPSYVVTVLISIDEFVHFIVFCAFMDSAVCSSFLFLFLPPVWTIWKERNNLPLHTLLRK